MINVENTTIKVVGSWNTKIFTPAFVNEVLLNAKETESLEIQFTQELQPIFFFKELTIIPTDTFVEIIVVKITEESAKKAIQVIFNLLAALPYTPNIALGFNYRLFFKNDAEKESFKFNIFPDFDLKNVSLQKKEDDFILNIVMYYDEQSTFNYNFHILKIDSINENTIFEQIKYIQTSWKI